MKPHRIAVVDDHEIVRTGLVRLFSTEPDIELVAAAQTMDELEPVAGTLDLVLLDLRLADSSTPAGNVASAIGWSVDVLIFSGGEDSGLVRQAARAGAVGMVRKSEANEAIVRAVRRALCGEIVASLDWAAALDSDSAIADAHLSPREQQVLTRYATGETAQSVAASMGISPDTVSDYVSRIRRKYALAGRTAASRVDLYHRATEDRLIERP